MKQISIKFFLVYSLLQSLLVSNAVADNLEELEPVSCTNRPDLCTSKKNRLTTYQPNYAIYQSTDDDDGSIEVHYSLKYKLTKPHCMNIQKGKKDTIDSKCLKKYRRRWELLFTYTGEFDFYAKTRKSDPVINRISNPALHARRHFDNSLSKKPLSLEWLNLGFEHRSNGQVRKANEKINDPDSSDFGKYRAQVELDKGNHEYFDEISRGANYISLEAKLNVGESNNHYKKCNATAKCVNIYIGTKFYFPDDDSDIFWGNQANKGVKISDYDRLKLVISDKFNINNDNDKSPFQEVELGLEWTIGDDLLKTDSIDINLKVPWVTKYNIRIPFYLRAHFGPMGTLSDYTKEQNSIGFGVRFD